MTSVEIDSYKLERPVEGPCDVAVLCFAGRLGNSVAKGGGWGPFQFSKTLATLNYNVLYVRDPLECWYQMGIHSLGDRVEDIAASIQEKLATFNARRVVSIGYSMGGYGAILFAHLLGLNKAVALAPQSFIDPAMRKQANDDRWQESFSRISVQRMQYPDLVPLVQQSPHRIPTSVYYCASDRLDTLHAERLKGLPQIALHAVEGEDHNVAKALKDQGRYVSVLREEIQRS